MKNILKSNINLLIGLIILTIFLSNCNEAPQATIVAYQPKAIEYDYSDSTLFKRINTYFENRYRAKRFNGTVLFAKKGKVVYHKAFGLSNFNTKDSLEVDDAFQLASVSKTITAVAVLKLVQDSLIQLDQNVKDFLPKFPYNNITVRHLLSHRSGLPNYMYFVDKIWENKDSSINNNEMLAIMQRDTPDYYYLPDVRYQYSNTNYAVLASIIERVTGDTYEQFLKKQIFRPLKMKDTFVYNRNTQPLLPKEVIGYNAIYRQKENHYFNGIVGDKGIYASVMDLFKFDQGLYENDFIDSTILAEAFTPHNPSLTRRNRDNYGLGWRIQSRVPGNKVVYHGGWWKGFKTYFIRMIDKNQTIIILTNTTRGGYINRMEIQELLE